MGVGPSYSARGKGGVVQIESFARNRSNFVECDVVKKASDVKGVTGCFQVRR